jgi:hypothetical protein
MFEQAAEECENLTSQCDQASEQIGELVNKAEKLGERAEKEMSLAHRAIEQLNDRLEEAQVGPGEQERETRARSSRTSRRRAARSRTRSRRCSTRWTRSCLALEDKKSEIADSISNAHDEMDEELESSRRASPTCTSRPTSTSRTRDEFINAFQQHVDSVQRGAERQEGRPDVDADDFKSNLGDKLDGLVGDIQDLMKNGESIASDLQDNLGSLADTC